MIEIWVSVDDNGCLKSLRSEGHSLYAPKGRNIVCAAVSTLLRSLVRSLNANDGCDSKIKIIKDGFLSVTINGCNCIEWLTGVSDIVICGLIEIEKDYPAECRLKLIKGANNGT